MRWKILFFVCLKFFIWYIWKSHFSVFVFTLLNFPTPQMVFSSSKKKKKKLNEEQKRTETNQQIFFFRHHFSSIFFLKLNFFFPSTKLHQLQQKLQFFFLCRENCSIFFFFFLCYKYSITTVTVLVFSYRKKKKKSKAKISVGLQISSLENKRLLSEIFRLTKLIHFSVILTQPPPPSLTFYKYTSPSCLFKELICRPATMNWFNDPVNNICCSFSFFQHYRLTSMLKNSVDL